MKFRNAWLLVAIFCALVMVMPVSAQEVKDAAADPKKPAIPESTDMTLDVKDSKYVMPKDFRGNVGGEGDLQWLEDVGYLMQENSNLYNVDAAAIAESAKFESEPNINWEVSKENEDGSTTTESSDNTNKATNPSNIMTPGFYQVHNGGARLVSTPGGAEDEKGAEGKGDAKDAVKDKAADGEEGAGADGESKTVTAQQRIGIQVHDCTSPDLWVAFQEGAGKVDMSETESELKAQMATKIIENQGQPFSKDAKDFEDASYIFLEEGADEKRNSIPWEKTARLSIAGTLFNERGAPKFESGTLKSKIDEKDYLNHVNVVGGEGKSLKGVYVRRNVPFIFAAIATDNGNIRATAGEVDAKIEDADGNEIAKDGAGYLFRVPNYPRDDYKDQPEYFFTANASDKDGNITTIRMPLYVVNTQAVFEGGKNR